MQGKTVQTASEISSGARYMTKKRQDKGTFLSEDIDVFVISPNRRTFHFLELENLNFGD